MKYSQGYGSTRSNVPAQYQAQSGMQNMGPGVGSFVPGSVVRVASGNANTTFTCLKTPLRSGVTFTLNFFFFLLFSQEVRLDRTVQWEEIWVINTVRYREILLLLSLRPVWCHPMWVRTRTSNLILPKWSLLWWCRVSVREILKIWPFEILNFFADLICFLV